MHSQPPLTSATFSRNERRTRRYRIAAASVLLVGLLFSLLIWYFTRQSVHTNEKARFVHYSEMTRTLLKERIDQNIAALRSLRAFIDASDQVRRSEWHQYIDDLDIGRHLQGSIGFSLIRYVRRDQLRQFVAATRADGAADFTVATAGNQPDLFIVEYVQPLERNKAIQGYDLGQEPARRQALAKAVETNEPTLSNHTIMAAKDDSQPGFLLLLPVYRNGAVLDSAEQRWQGLIGWVGTSIQLSELFAGITGYFNSPLDIEVFDNRGVAVNVLLYDADGQLHSVNDPAAASRADNELHSRVVLPIADRNWALHIYALPGFHQPIEHHMPEALLLGGGIMSLIASLLVASYGRTSKKAQILAEKMTRDLRESEQRFKGMFRKHNAVMLLIDPDDGRILDANTAASRFYGYGEQQLISMNVNDLNLSPPEEVAKARWQILTGKVNTFEFRHRLASGETCDVEVHSSPIEYAGHTVLFSIIHNITPRKQAQQALAESEQKYRVLFDETAHGTAVADRETGIILACNRKLAQMLGRKVNEIVGQPHSFLHPPESLNYGKSRSFNFYLGQASEQVVTDQLLTKDGQRIDVEIKATNLVVNGREALIGSFYDISDRKRAEKSLRESEARFRLVFESHPDPVLLIHFSSGEILDVNRAFEIATRISRTEALGHDTEELGLWRDPMQRQLYWSLLRAEGTINNFEAEFTVVGGLVRTGLFSARQLTINREPCVLATIRDITTEKAAERSLIEMDRIKSEFISTAAHELNTPLTAILGFTELLRTPEHFGEFGAEQQNDFLDQIYERGKALSRIVDDLLDISRIESGKPITLDLQPVALDDVLNRVIEFYRLHDSDHHFELNCPASAEPAMRIDRQRINQVLENLLSNAVKYSGKGSTIRIEGIRQSDGWEIRVKDQGIGMTAEQVERVFDKFYRADASNTAIGGLGLGMSIARQIIDAHNGKIWIESTPGQGTTVYFTLPTRQAESAADASS